MNQPLVSIIIPVYNAEKWLADALQSAIDQSVSDIEIIAVDDASTDGSLEILRSFAQKDPRIKILANERNLGQAGSRNRGIDASTGRWLAFLDNDDLLAPDFCKVLLAEAEIGGVRPDIIKGRARIIMPDGRIYESSRQRQQDIMRKSPLCFNEHWWTAIYRADKIRGKVRQPENISLGEDLIFLVDAISQPMKVACIDDIVYIYMLRTNSASELRNRSLKKIADNIDSAIPILQILNERQVHVTDPYGYRVWASEALYWLGLFYLAKADEYETAIRISAAKAPQVVSLVRCGYPGIKKFLMPLALKILKDDRLMFLRLFIFHCFGFIKKSRRKKSIVKTPR